MKNKSICFICPTLLIRRPISELAILLSKKGWDVSILAPRKIGKWLDRSLHHVNLKNIKVLSYPTVSLPLINFDWPIPVNFQIFRHLKYISRNYRVVQIWTFFYVSVCLPLLYLGAKNKNRLLLTLDTIPGVSFPLHGLFGVVFRLYTKTIGKWIFNKPDIITVYSYRLKSILQKMKVKKRIEILPTGIIPRAKKPKKPYVRKELGLTKDDFVVTFIGLVTPRKGVDTLIKIASRTDTKFVVVGEGPNMSRYKKRATENIKFTGSRTDVYNILDESDVLILPSRGEGLPGVVFEAMEAGVPVVASNIPCIDEQIVSRKDGILCPPEDVKAFASALQKLKTNRALRRKMGLSAKKRIKGFYWTNLLDKYFDIYGGK